MAKIDKLKKEIKALKKEAAKVIKKKKAAEEQITKLKRRIDKRNREIADLRLQIESQGPVYEIDDEFGEIHQDGVASGQKEAWKRFSYLRNRYELHLSEGTEKPRARKQANSDLIERFGSTAGYSAGELDDILS